MTPTPCRRDKDVLVVVQRVEVGGVLSMVEVPAEALLSFLVKLAM